MSLENTHDIETVKIVMVGAGGGGGSYTAGNGISITNNVITNTRKGALTGVIDSVSSNIAHTQIDNALTTTTAGALVVLKAETSGTSIDTIRIQYGAQASDSRDFRLKDTSGNYTTIDVASDDTIIMMLNATGYQMIVLSILGASTGGGYAGLGIGKKTGVTSNVIDTDIDLHRAPIVGDRLLIYFDEKVTNPTGLTTYNNGTAVTSNLENVTPLYINAGLNILQYEDSFLATGWVRKQNVPVPTTLAGMSDTLIVSPSDGQMLVYDNNMWKNKTALQANPTGTAVRELKKIQIGDNVFDTFGLKPFDVTSVTSGVNGSISVDVITASQLDGEIIAVHTGSNSGTTGNAWTLALSDGQTIEALTMSKGGSAYTDAITANCLLFVKCDIGNSTAVVLGIAGASGGGASALTDLTDTAISTPTNGQVLTYNGTTGKWGNQTPSGVATSVVGTVESGTTASQAYAVGEHFIRNDKFCTCISAIASGATLTLNTNYVEGTIADNITKRVKYSTSEHIIGTWIDGSTLYEKTIDCGNCLGSTGDVSFSCNFGENITVVDIECVSISKGTDVQITVPFNWDNTYDIGISYSPYWATNNRDMLLFRVKSARSNYQTFATLRYVKGRLYT